MKLNIMEEVGGNLSRGSLTVLEMERIGNILPRSHALDQITRFVVLSSIVFEEIILY